MKIKLGKKWRQHKKGAELSVLGEDLSLRRDGTAVNQRTGKTVNGPFVDSVQAVQLRADGFLEDPVKAKKESKR